MIKKIILIIIYQVGFLAQLNLHAAVNPQSNYPQRLYNAFLIQSIGETRMAYRVFKGAFQDAKNAGESKQKLAVLNELFIWYRTYGWSCHLTTKPSHCDGEYYYPEYTLLEPTADSFYPDQQQRNYLIEWAKTPQGSKYIRSFLFGVAEITASFFACRIGTPMGYSVALTLGGEGATRIFDAVNDGMADYQERKRELIAIQLRAQKAMQE